MKPRLQRSHVSHPLTSCNVPCPRDRVRIWPAVHAHSREPHTPHDIEFENACNEIARRQPFIAERSLTERNIQQCGPQPSRCSPPLRRRVAARRSTPTNYSAAPTRCAACEFSWRTRASFELLPVATASSLSCALAGARSTPQQTLRLEHSRFSRRRSGLRRSRAVGQRRKYACASRLRTAANRDCRLTRVAPFTGARPTPQHTEAQAIYSSRMRDGGLRFTSNE